MFIRNQELLPVAPSGGERSPCSRAALIENAASIRFRIRCVLKAFLLRSCLVSLERLVKGGRPFSRTCLINY